MIPGVVLFCMNTCMAQSIDDSLAAKFIQYQQDHLREKIYVHTDKDLYLAGETIWFKLYIADAFFHKPLPVSIIAYVEVIGPNRQPVLQTAIDIASATGYGSFTVPSSIASGNYTVRAYTSWMKNYSDAFFFSRSISIINTLTGSLPKNTINKPDTITANFYPEGGNLVYGLSSRVAFRLTNKYGETVAGNGVITGAKNDTLVQFRTLQDGTGSFYFTPHKNSNYKVLLNTGGIYYKANLPAVYDEGYTMELHEDTGKNQLQVTISTNIKNTGNVYLLAHTRQVLKASQRAAINTDGKAVFYIDEKLLGDGIAHIMIFNGKKQPVCERLFFKQPLHRATAVISTNKELYSTREEVSAAISVKDEKDVALQANMSASVFLLDSLQRAPRENIATYFLLTSELKNKIDDPSLFFDNNSSLTKQTIDHIMLTNGWSRFKWEDIFTSNDKCFYYLPEKEGRVIKARLISRNSGQPVQNVANYLSVPGKNFVLSNAVSDDMGAMNFILTPTHQRNEMIFHSTLKGDSNYMFDISDYYSRIDDLLPAGVLDIRPGLKNDLQQRGIYMQVENSFAIEKKHRWIGEAPWDTTLFYGYPDKEYKLDDYTRFLTMEEVLKEYVSEVSIKKQGEQFSLRVKERTQGTFFDNDPLVLIDGVPVQDAGKMIKFDPLKIRSIDVVASRYFQGTQVYDGIVSFKTYEGDLAGYELDPNDMVVEYSAIQKKQEFYQPVYNNAELKKSRLPDFRNVLSWEPDINLAGNGTAEIKFYTSDCTGQFLVFLQGLSKNGLPINATKLINVVP